MKRIAYWLLSPLILLVIWLLLNNTLALGQVLLGAILSLLLAWAAMALRPLRSMPKRPLTMFKLVCHVVCDITLSNIAVAKLIWRGPYSHTPGFIKIPIEARDPHAMAALACIITYTPGTVWAGFSDENNVLTLHVLDLHNEQYWIDLIKQRYERPLIEIFE